MTGFLESELIGRLPPFPYWPPDRIDENNRLLQQELQGRSPAGGIEVKVMRKDGSSVRLAHVRLAADRPEGPADRLDDQR
jgi:PAS domain S-box-containing protein